ncbi:unnamed protein product [Lymnaea stagnalis]|uniref:Golgi-associated plant pathogenesis-related protein 1 n=1 Tax=Lymnaea stagnalis TaxID=6523 RepID=A0AAV2I8P1_LYMST
MGCSSTKPKERATIVESLPKGSKSLITLRNETLAAHNKFRKLHGAPPLKLSPDLNTMAQKWADYLADKQVFEHSPESHRFGAGENLAGHSDIITGNELVDMWYSEIMGHNSANLMAKTGIGHVNQVDWKDCTHIGVGRSSSRGMNDMYIYVANYLPTNTRQEQLGTRTPSKGW